MYIDTVDGSDIPKQPNGMVLKPRKSWENFQPQLVSRISEPSTVFIKI